MKTMVKYIVSIISLLGIGCGSIFAAAPSFDNNFANYLTDATPDQYGRVETVFSFSSCIDKTKPLMDNVKALLYPSIISGNSACGASTGGLLWDVVRYISYVLVFLFLVVAGIQFLMNPDSAEKTKKSGMSIGYIAYGSFLVFGAIWILGYALNLENLKGSTELVSNLQNNVFLQILTFFKVLAFFFAIVMMVVAGFKMMSSMDKADKAKAGTKAIVNIIVALVLIKVIDYVFYIAQLPNFAQKASDLILDIAKVLGWVIGIAFILAMLYGGYNLFVAGGDEKAMKKTKGIVINILVVSAVVFFFLLIIYQIFNEFVK